MYEFSDNLQTIIEKIVKAIEKAVGEDIRSYLANSNTATNNAIPFLRGDYINTNIKYAMENEAVEIKNFKRASWTGMLFLSLEESRLQCRFVLKILWREFLRTKIAEAHTIYRRWFTKKTVVKFRLFDR